jgi:uncharacterized membrane protein
MNNLLIDVLLCVGAGFFGMLAVVTPVIYLMVWAAEKYYTKQYKKAGWLK